MIAVYLICALVVILILGALDGGNTLGEVIRRGIKTILAIVFLILLAMLIYEYWPLILTLLQEYENAKPPSSHPQNQFSYVQFLL